MKETLNNFIEYVSSRERWNELGHAFFGFIAGSMGWMIGLLWLGFVLYQELIRDGHKDFSFESRDKQLDLFFDLQSKLASMLLGLVYVYFLNPSFLTGLIVILLILFFGWKAPWFKVSEEE